MKQEQQSEKKMPTKCLICAATPVDPSTEGVGSDYAFCSGHLAVLHDTPAQRATLLHVKQDLALKRVAISVDANGVGWFHRLPPEPAPVRPPITLDDGSLRYRDWDPSAIIGSGGGDDGQTS